MDVNMHAKGLRQPDQDPKIRILILDSFFFAAWDNGLQFQYGHAKRVYDGMRYGYELTAIGVSRDRVAAWEIM